MAKTLNFNNIKKEYLTVTLPDEKRTVLMVGTPGKALLSELMSIKNAIDNYGEDMSEDSIDNLFYICARLMSRNKGGIEITKEYIEELFDIEDILIFVHAYLDFVTELASSKN